MISRRSVYGISLLIFLATVALSLASIAIPEWISWTTPSNPKQAPRHYTYGLHAQCDSSSGSCTPFPTPRDCQDANAGFCTAWRTAGFLMSFAVILEFATLSCFAILLLGGKQKRERGWPILCGLLTVTGLLQAGAMGIAVGALHNEDRFIKGWVLGRSWSLCVLSLGLQLSTTAGVGVAMVILPQEGGYELIPEGEDRDRGPID